MKKWIPSEKELEYLKLVISMTTDCLVGNGVDTRHTYTENLIMIADKLKDVD